jgi:hypothetical protein
MADVTNPVKPIAVGILSPKQSFVAIWRIDGDADVRIRTTAKRAEIVYPTDLGVKVNQSGEDCVVTFPRSRMGCILSI